MIKTKQKKNSEWEVKKLGVVCDFLNGLWKGKKPPYVDVNIIRNTNFTKDGFLDDSDIANLPVEIKQYEKRKLKFGDIILEKSGGGPKQPVGRVIIFNKEDGEYSFSNFTSAIRIKDKEELDFNFLHRFLYFQYISGATNTMQKRSTGIRNLQLKEYKEIEISYPKSLDEQRRIVEVLDRSFEAIEKAKENVEKNLQNAKELFDSYLQKVFSEGGDDWEEKKLGEVCEIDKKTHDIEKSLPFVGMEDIESGTGKFIGSLEDKKMKARTFYFTKKHFLYGRLRPYLNKILLPNFEGHCSTEIFPILPNDNLDRSFLFYWFINQKIVDKINKTCTGARMPRANVDEILEFDFILPSIKKQKEIVKKLDELRGEVERLEAILRSKIAGLDELKKSILEKVFSGEL